MGHNGKREYPEQADFIDYLRTHNPEINEIRKRQFKGHLGSKKVVNQVLGGDYDAMDMWKTSVNHIKLGEQRQPQEQSWSTPPPPIQGAPQQQQQQFQQPPPQAQRY